MTLQEIKDSYENGYIAADEMRNLALYHELMTNTEVDQYMASFRNG